MYLQYENQANLPFSLRLWDTPFLLDFYYFLQEEAISFLREIAKFQRGLSTGSHGESEGGTDGHLTAGARRRRPKWHRPGWHLTLISLRSPQMQDAASPAPSSASILLASFLPVFPSLFPPPLDGPQNVEWPAGSIGSFRYIICEFSPSLCEHTWCRLWKNGNVDSPSPLATWRPERQLTNATHAR